MLNILDTFSLCDSIKTVKRNFPSVLRLKPHQIKIKVSYMEIEKRFDGQLLFKKAARKQPHLQFIDSTLYPASITALRILLSSTFLSYLTLAIPLW